MKLITNCKKLNGSKQFVKNIIELNKLRVITNFGFSDYKQQ